MKMTFITTAAALALAAASFANDSEELTSQEKRARRKARMEARIAAEGGIVSKPNNGNFARVVNCQKKVSTDFIKSVVDQFNTGLNVHIEVSEAEPEDNPFNLAKKALAIPRTGIAAIIVDDGSLPTLLSAMEEGWAILNIRHLRDDLPPKAVYEMRLRKEINRAFAEAAGAGLSFNGHCVMGPVYSPADLDGLSFPIIGPEAMSKISQVCMKRGIPAFRSATYLNACQEGWAPAPTNEVQKAIWDKVHEMPSEPIKIKYQKPDQAQPAAK